MRSIIANYINTWERRCYPKGIPDEAPSEIFDMVPSYKRICIAIMKNDLTIIGIERKKSQVYNELKRIELKERGVIKSKQLNIFE